MSASSLSRRATFAVLCVAQFVMVLDTTVMNVSISQVVADLHTTVESVQAAITLYALVMSAFMLSGAKLGDLWGRRRAFTIGIAVYGVGSLTTALSGSITALLIGWSLIEGLGAVLVIPAIATLQALKTALLWAAGFALIGLWFARRLPDEPLESDGEPDDSRAEIQTAA